MTKKVLFIESHIPQYRVAFFERARADLAYKGIDFQLIGGQGSSSDRARKDAAQISWATSSRNIHLLGGKLILQPCLFRSLSADLVIVDQANKLLLNYVLQFLRPFFRMRLAFWGHGFCHQQPLNSLSNKFKSLIIKNADWWFAYTSSVAEYVAAQGFPKDRMTIVQNAIDTSALSQMAARITTDEILLIRKKYNLTEGKTGVFCGGMYKEKQVPFLIHCAEQLHLHDREFSMIFIGSGVDAHFVDEAASRHPWIHYVGPQFGFEKVKLILAADFMLIPGAVGLAILDGFALQRPLVTTDCPGHGPEIAYLDNNSNGILTPFTKESYSEAIASLIREPGRLRTLRRGCEESGRRYTIEAMVGNFVDGVCRCLQIDTIKSVHSG
jgi:L-malate glycosyltransferase